jgi:hypothetical protein
MRRLEYVEKYLQSGARAKKIVISMRYHPSNAGHSTVCEAGQACDYNQ